MSSEQTVMPSCVVASMRVACSIAHSVICAALDPCSARGSICERRAEMTANSAATKKALPPSSTNSQKMPHQSELIGRPPWCWSWCWSSSYRTPSWSVVLPAGASVGFGV